MSEPLLPTPPTSTFISYLISSFQIPLVLCTTFIILILHTYLRRDSRIKKQLDKIPGPRPLPIVGNSLAFNVPSTELLQAVSSLFAKYGPIVRLWMFNLPYVLISSAKDVQTILSSTVHINKSRDYDIMRPWLGNGLGLAGGAHWSSRRKLLTPAFSFGLQDEFLQVFNEQGSIFQKVVESECVDKGIVNLFPYCSRWSLDVICEAAFGTKIQAQTQKSVKYLENILAIAHLIAKRILQPWLQPNLLWKLSGNRREEKKLITMLHSFTDKIIQEKKLSLENKTADETRKTTRPAFLDLILQANKNGSGLTDEDIRNETDIFMVAGHDTPGSSLAWTLFLLAHNPEIQRKVQSELDEIFGDEPLRKITTEDLARMQYLEMCSKESLRLRPPVPYIFRALHDDLTLSDGKLLPKGSTVGISIWDLHRDPKVFPNPDQFDPERFSPEKCRERSSYAYVPFAAGPRNCIGQAFAKTEAKVILASALRSFWFEPGESLEGVQIIPDVNLRTVNGLNFKISNRSR